MIIIMKRSFALAFVSVSIVSHPVFAADEWQPIKVNGHDYLTVENIAKFYGLPAEVTAQGGKIQIETVKHSLEFVRGSREVVINGARSWLCFPLMEQNGKFLVSRTDVAIMTPQSRPSTLIGAPAEERIPSSRAAVLTASPPPAR